MNRTIYIIVIGALTAGLLLALSGVDLRPRPFMNGHSGITRKTLLNGVLLNKCGIKSNRPGLFAFEPPRLADDLILAITSWDRGGENPLVNFALFKDKTVVVADDRSQSGFYSWTLQPFEYNHYIAMLARLQSIGKSNFGNNHKPSYVDTTKFTFKNIDGSEKSITVCGPIVEESLLMPFDLRRMEHVKLPTAVVDTYYDGNSAFNPVAKEWRPTDYTLNFYPEYTNAAKQDGHWSMKGSYPRKGIGNAIPIQMSFQILDASDLQSLYTMPAGHLKSIIASPLFVDGKCWLVLSRDLPAQ